MNLNKKFNFVEVWLYQNIVGIIGIAVSIFIAYNIYFLSKRIDIRNHLSHRESIKNAIIPILDRIRPGESKKIELVNIKRYLRDYPLRNTHSRRGYTFIASEIKDLRFDGLEVFCGVKELFTQKSGEFTLVSKDNKKHNQNALLAGIIPYEWIEYVDEFGDEITCRPQVYVRFNSKEKTPYKYFRYYIESENFNRENDMRSAQWKEIRITNNMAEVFNQELSIKQIFTLSYKKYKELWKKILLLVLIIMIPVDLLTTLFPNYKIATVVSLNGILSTIVQLLFTLAIAYLLRESFNNKEISYKDAMKFGFERFGAGVKTFILAFLLLVPLFIALIVPGIIFSLYWQFIIYVVAFSNLEGRAALKESKKIVAGRWWKVFWYTISFYLIIFAITFVASLPFFWLSDSPAFDLIVGIISSLVSSFLVLLIGIYYMNLDNTKSLLIKKEIASKE